MLRVTVQVWFAPRTLAESAVPLQRALGDRLRIPVQRLQTAEGEQVYVADMLGFEEEGGTLGDAVTTIEHEVNRFFDNMLVRDGAQIQRVQVDRV